MATVTSTPSDKSVTINKNSTSGSTTITWSAPTVPSGGTITSCVLSGTITPSSTITRAKIGNTSINTSGSFSVNLGTSISTSASVSLTKSRGTASTVKFTNLLYTVTYTEPVTYTVRFLDHNGTVLKTQTVQAGQSATPPSNPTREGYTFTGWSGSYSNITSNTDITAQYNVKSIEVIDWSGLGTIATGLRAYSEVPHNTYNINLDWDNESFDVILTGEFNRNSHLGNSIFHTATIAYVIIGDAEIAIQFSDGSFMIYNPNSDISMVDEVMYSNFPTSIRFTKKGIYLINNDNTSTLFITDSEKLYEASNPICFIDDCKPNSSKENPDYDVEFSIAVNEFILHTVTFKDWDGTVLKTEEVEPGQAVTPPEDPTRLGYTFIGWSTDKYTNVTGNLTVTALYKTDASVEVETINATLRPISATEDNGYNNTWSNIANIYDTDTATAGTLIITGTGQGGFVKDTVTTLFNFDTSSIPADATINSAVLTVRAKSSADTNLYMSVDINGDSANRVISEVLMTKSAKNVTADVANYIMELNNIALVDRTAGSSSRTFTLYDVRIDVQYTVAVAEDPDNPDEPDNPPTTTISNLKMGDKEINSMYIGNDEILAIYLGDIPIYIKEN